MSDPTSVVEAFCAAWPAGDLDAIMAFFTDDAVYHNIPLAPASGTEAIRSTIETFIGGAQIEFRIDNIAAAGDVVFTERVDIFTLPNGRIELPVAGVFELRGDKIAAWRDYFDMNQFMSGMPS